MAVEKKDIEMVDAEVVTKKEKKKKSKKTTEETPAAEETPVVEEAPEKKKKSKKRKEPEAGEEEAPVEEPAKKKKKKEKKAEEEVVEEAAVEEAAAEEEKPKKKKKKSKTEEAPAEETEEKTEEKEVEEEKAEEKEEKIEEEEKEEQKQESKTVFINGLPYNTDEETVKKDFAECGEVVSFRLPKDYEGNVKGIAFCEYTSQEGVKKALEFNETEYGGRTIYVRIAEEDKGKGKGKKGEKGKGKGKGKKGGGEPMQPSERPDPDCKSVIIKNMSFETTEDTLWAMFEPCGPVERVNLLKDKETGASRGMCFVDFGTPEACDAAVKLCNTEKDGRLMFIDYAVAKGKGDGKKGDGKKGDKGKGKDGKGKGKGKGKKGKAPSAAVTANRGSIVEATGEKKTFADSDSD